MRYEIYIDTLFLMNLGMNIYLLELTNCILKYASTWKRVVIGAVCGSLCMSIPMCFFLPMGLAEALGFVSSILVMSRITFRINGLEGWLHVIEMISVLTVLISSILQYMLFRLPDIIQRSILWILLLGAAGFSILRRLFFRSQCTYECKVTLKNKTTKMVVNGLIDTGNGLIEPISGVPIAVLDKGVFNSLFHQNKPGGFRVIPYQSIDQKNGIMPGYLIPEIVVEWDGCCRVYQNVYVGIPPEGLNKTGKYKMILNPDMLKERKIG